jgi:hypothetical protein
LEQRLGFLKVGGVEALSEPAVDGGEQLAGFISLAMALPQPARLKAPPSLLSRAIVRA